MRRLCIYGLLLTLMGCTTSNSGYVHSSEWRDFNSPYTPIYDSTSVYTYEEGPTPQMSDNVMNARQAAEQENDEMAATQQTEINAGFDVEVIR